MTERTFDFEADYGAGYEALARRVLFGYDQLFAMALSWLRQGVGEEAQALVVGSGPGLELAHFGALEPGWRLTGVDPSAQMVALAREKVRANGLADRVTLVHGLVDDLPAEPGFDAASAVCVMHFLRDDGSKRAFLDGIARRLRPGARLALFDLHGRPGSAAFEARLAAWKAFMAYRGQPRDEADWLVREVLGELHLVTEERTLELLAQAGFDAPARFYAAHLYGGWVARRG